MLRNIPACISPELIYTLMSMGHGGEIVLADADFPAETHSDNFIRADGLDVATLLEAILPFFPLDSFVEKPVMTMDYRAWSDREPEVYEAFRQIIKENEPKFTDFEFVERFEFYERAKKAYAVVITGEPDGNIILKKAPVMV